MPGGYAEFHGLADLEVTAPMANFDMYLYATLVESIGDPSVFVQTGGLVFNEGLFIVTASIVTEVAVPTDSADQLLRLESSLTGAVGTGG